MVTLNLSCTIINYNYLIIISVKSMLPREQSNKMQKATMSMDQRIKESIDQQIL